jgi:phage terminase large subunit
VSESFPHLKRGVMRDFLSILEGHNYYKEYNWNKSDFIYTFETGSKIEFFSADQPDKVRGPRRDRLFINEVNNIPFDAFDQLEVRTNDFIYLDWNPTNEFWFYTELFNKRDDIEHIILSYLDNEALNDNIRRSIEARKERKNWWKVYGLGELGETEGKIFNDWRLDIDEIPHNARLERYGVDFGYTNDPTAIVAIYYYDGGYILDEIAYGVGMKNRIIADILLNQEKKALVVADSSEPKSIDEIKERGVEIVGVSKTKGETKDKNFQKWSIELTQEQRISVTKRSLNIIKEYRNFLWEKDRDGKQLNVPEHEYSHSMKAIIYGFVSLLKKPQPILYKQSIPILPYYGDRDISF